MLCVVKFIPPQNGGGDVLPVPVGAGDRSPFQLCHQHHSMGWDLHTQPLKGMSLHGGAAWADVRERADKPCPRVLGWCPQTAFTAPSASSR